MKRKQFIAFSLTCMSLLASTADAQVFSDSRWDQNTVIMGKYSPLYYELNVGANVSPDNYSADFLYFSVGYGKPSTSNDWTKFLDQQEQTGTPPSQPSQPSQPSSPPSGGSGSGTPSQPSQPSAPSTPEGSVSGLHAGMIALGWQHYFNHVIGVHIQAGWGFVADFGSGDDSNQEMQNSSSSDKEEGGKKTFIYNGIPTQAGIDINLWEHLALQVGATYMWKEKPYITVGLGWTF